MYVCVYGIYILNRLNINLFNILTSILLVQNEYYDVF